MVITAVAFHFLLVSKDLTLETTAVKWAVDYPRACYDHPLVAFYASGLATIGWVGTELLPTEVRALGTMMNTVTCCGGNLIVASTFPTTMKSMTPSGAFGFYSVVCFLGWVLILFRYPEVKGLPLENVRQVFADGLGVGKAACLQKMAASTHFNDEEKN